MPYAQLHVEYSDGSIPCSDLVCTGRTFRQKGPDTVAP